jgi:hypothetical protein
MNQVVRLADVAIERINAIEEENATRPQVEIETIERIIGSMYTREIFIPKGVGITSRVYKRGYVDIMLSGDITIEDTNGIRRLTGCNILEGTAGRKRAGLAHEDTRWITVHDTFDIKTNPIEDISFETLEEYDEFTVNLAKKSYLEFLTEFNLKDEAIRYDSENEPYKEIDSDEFYISESKIDGTGVFASRRFVAGEIIGPMAQEGNKTQLGRFVNHSGYPNTNYMGSNIMATRAIDAGQELTISYNLSERLLCQE